MAFQNFQEKEVNITSMNMTTQGHGVSTSQYRASSHVTSQAPASQQSTSSGITSSLTATSGNVMGNPSSLTPFSKTCSTSKKSFNSDENRDGSDPNTKQEMNKTSNERQSSNISTVSKDESNSSPESKTTNAMNQKSNKPKFPAQAGRKAQKTSKNHPKTFTSGETGSGEMTPATEMNARSFPGKGRKAFPRTNREGSFGAKKLQAIISDQEKVLSTSGPEQYQAVEIHRSREKCERKKVTDM
jgi:hypothetical protein